MVNINIIAVGKLKEDFLRNASKEYEKRLSAYAKVKIIEIDEERLSDNPSEKEIEKALAVEAEKIMSASKKSSIISLCIEGKQLSSVEFSEKIGSFMLNGVSDISFVIGSSHGLHSSVKDKSVFKMSFSKMTFPHQLFRVMLLEQIYRAFSIQNKSRYHK